MALWIHLIFYSMMAHIPEMPLLALEVDYWQFYGSFSCVFVGFVVKMSVSRLKNHIWLYGFIQYFTA